MDDAAARRRRAVLPVALGELLAITLVLVALNVLLIVLVHGRRIRQYLRGGRERRFQAQLDEVIAKLDQPTSVRDRLSAAGPA